MYKIFNYFLFNKLIEIYAQIYIFYLNFKINKFFLFFKTYMKLIF